MASRYNVYSATSHFLIVMPSVSALVVLSIAYWLPDELGTSCFLNWAKSKLFWDFTEPDNWRSKAKIRVRHHPIRFDVMAPSVT